MTRDHGSLEAVEAALVERAARQIAREEIASLCGLVLGRLGELDPGVVDRRDLAVIVGEALRDFGGSIDEPGPKTIELGGEIRPEGEASI